MKPRGRAPAPSDEAAVIAQDALLEYLRKNSLNVAKFSRLTGCSQPAIWNALKRKPPAWSPTLRKLSEFLSDLNATSPSGTEQIAARLAGAARGTRDASATTARLLRMVADLLDSSGAPEDGPISR